MWCCRMLLGLFSVVIVRLYELFALSCIARGCYIDSQVLFLPYLAEIAGLLFCVMLCCSFLGIFLFTSLSLFSFLLFVYRSILYGCSFILA